MSPSTTRNPRSALCFMVVTSDRPARSSCVAKMLGDFLQGLWY